MKVARRCCSGIARSSGDGSWPWLNLATRESLLLRTSRRAGETKLGERVAVPSAEAQVPGKPAFASASAALGASASAGTNAHPRYGVVGVPEDVGPVANLGRAGARGAWSAFLDVFVNMQANGAGFDAEDVLVVGEVDVADLQAEADARVGGLPRLRELVGELDARVAAAVSAVLRRGMEVVVIGGGHNNCLPLIKACAEHHGAPIGASDSPCCPTSAQEGQVGSARIPCP
jgi:formiminoglutamase